MEIAEKPKTPLLLAETEAETEALTASMAELREDLAALQGAIASNKEQVRCFRSPQSHTEAVC